MKDTCKKNDDGIESVNKIWKSYIRVAKEGDTRTRSRLPHIAAPCTCAVFTPAAIASPSFWIRITNEIWMNGKKGDYNRTENYKLGSSVKGSREINEGILQNLSEIEPWEREREKWYRRRKSFKSTSTSQDQREKLSRQTGSRLRQKIYVIMIITVDGFTFTHNVHRPTLNFPFPVSQ